MGTTLSAVKCPSSEREVRALLKSWVEMVERYCTQHENQDNPWWYNERASLSTLAGAAWSSGWSALEEYSSVKRQKAPADGVEHGDTRLGRVDLFVMSPKGTSMTFEAKHAWQRIGPRANRLRYVEKGMKAAWEDSNSLISSHSDRRFAATFVAPSLALGDIEGDNCQELLMKQLNEWLKETGDFTRKGGKPPFFAYVFPSIAENSFDFRNRHYPGVVLILEERIKASGRRTA
ncbi:hypothetical protein OF113_14025 [Ectopseudomonas chengduensis]|nr:MULTISPECIES: hypothetical protein [Pseudomonas]MDZ4190740.1 hypothetical protein [Pseudomonas sp.]UZT76190.1 hypothetical protein OF113_14025 [Pseudomonas chengduensis]